mmetsp:Transcript_7393/g.18643  ORF Transcript_7393/g.18643 Transcript_7393/m.18643 type:complete len:203 (+) Transcript_7393:175-783(+)
MQEGTESPLDLAAIDVVDDVEEPLLGRKTVADGEQRHNVVELEAAVWDLLRTGELVLPRGVRGQGVQGRPGLGAEHRSGLPQLLDRGPLEGPLLALEALQEHPRLLQKPAREVRDVHVPGDQEEPRLALPARRHRHGARAEALRGRSLRGVGGARPALVLQDSHHGRLASRGLARTSPCLLGLGVTVEGARIRGRPPRPCRS